MTLVEKLITETKDFWKSKRPTTRLLRWAFLGLTIPAFLNYGLKTPIRNNRSNIEQVIAALKATETPEQIQLDRQVDNQDISEITSESCGYLVKTGENTYEVRQTPTIHQFFSDTKTPEPIRDYLDKHHIRVPFWYFKEGFNYPNIVTTWHSHVHGEIPSKGDTQAGGNEIVRLGGIIPARYLVKNGDTEFIPYGSEDLESKLPRDVQLILGQGILPPDLQGNIDETVGLYSDEIKLQYFQSALGYLQIQGYDLNNLESILQGLNANANQILENVDGQEISPEINEMYARIFSSFLSSKNRLKNSLSEKQRTRLALLLDTEDQQKKFKQIGDQYKKSRWTRRKKTRKTKLVQLAYDDIPELRTRNSKTWRNEDGSYTTEIGHLHTQARDGTWRDLANIIEQTETGDYEYIGPLYSFFSEEDSCIVSIDGQTLGLKVEGAQRKRAGENEVIYTKKGINLAYRLSLENIITSITFEDLQAINDFSISIDRQGEKSKIEPPRELKDNQGYTSEAFNELTKDSLKISGKKEWLEQANYPIETIFLICPPRIRAETRMGSINMQEGLGAFKMLPPSYTREEWLGIELSDSKRGFIQFPTYQIPENANIIEAYLKVNVKNPCKKGNLVTVREIPDLLDYPNTQQGNQRLYNDIEAGEIIAITDAFQKKGERVVFLDSEEIRYPRTSLGLVSGDQLKNYVFVIGNGDLKRPAQHPRFGIIHTRE